MYSYLFCLSLNVYRNLQCQYECKTKLPSFLLVFVVFEALNNYTTQLDLVITVSDGEITIQMYVIKSQNADHSLISVTSQKRLRSAHTHFIGSFVTQPGILNTFLR